ncbi:MAG: hypothetical protein H7831_17245 [Magnetococcus sp. WYHC-3]
MARRTQQHTENVAFRDKRFADTIAFFQKVLEDKSLTHEQRKQQIKDFVAKERTAAKAHWEQQKEERKAERAKIHDNHATKAPAANP